jgi:hypothetical protein
MIPAKTSACGDSYKENAHRSGAQVVSQQTVRESLVYWKVDLELQRVLESESTEPTSSRLVRTHPLG